MTDLNILWLTHKGDGYVGAPQTQYGFEQEVAKITNSVFAGEGWKDFKRNESIPETVERCMPDADWVIDRDNNLTPKPRNTSYKIGHFISDIHAKHKYNMNNPVEYVELLNKVGYDKIFMRYPLLYGTNHRPKIVYDRLNCAKEWSPWSADIDYYTPAEKSVDVSFIGRVNDAYPLRRLMWNGLYYVGRGRKLIREQPPFGTTYQRDIAKHQEQHLVGDKYRDALAETRILIFGCSIYRYALQKFTEASASGCLMICNQPTMNKRLGFIDGETYVEVDEVDWEEKLLYYMDNPEEAEKIATNGMKNTRKLHSHKVRAQQFLEMLQ